MSRYRIVPVGLDQWGVQGKWLFWWRDMGQWTGYEHWSPHLFGTEQQARLWLADYLKREIKLIERQALIRRRRRTVRPIDI